MQLTPQKIKSWLKPNGEGFLQWLDDIKPKIPSAKGGFEQFKLEDFQEEFIRQALATREDGVFRYQTIVISLPRRHSKTTLMALLVLWRFTTRTTENIVVLSNSQRQNLGTAFKTLRGIVLNTQTLYVLIGKPNIKKEYFAFPVLQNHISAETANPTTLYGQKVTCGWISELHAAQSDEGAQVIASSIGDSINSWLIVDSTVDPVGGPLHRLEQLANPESQDHDPTIFYYNRSYNNLEEALEKSPSWINRDWLRSRQKQLLPAVFGSQHLNQRSQAANNLFSREQIQACIDPSLPHPIEPASIPEITQGRNYLCGGGLDRAYGFSVNADQTVWTSIMMVANPDTGEPDYYILNQQSIMGGLGRSIKKQIKQDVDNYALKNITLESYNAQDIHQWALDQQYPAEVVYATSQAQAAPFMELYRIISEGRLHFSDKLKTLPKELETFVYEIGTAGTPKFGHQKGFHDDHIYSLVWSIHSLRQQELSSFLLNGISCDSRSKHAPLCYLRAGDAILQCASSCEAHKRVETMFGQYRGSRLDSELTLPEFFKSFIKVKGIRTYNSL